MKSGLIIFITHCSHGISNSLNNNVQFNFVKCGAYGDRCLPYLPSTLVGGVTAFLVA